MMTLPLACPQLLENPKVRERERERERDRDRGDKERVFLRVLEFDLQKEVTPHYHS